MNRLKSLAILLIAFFCYYLFFIKKIEIGCIFLKLFSIPCPACGLTRAFKEILNFNFIGALKYNVISIIVFIFISIFLLLNVYILITNKKVQFNITRKHVVITIVLLLISFIVNQFRY